MWSTEDGANLAMLTGHVGTVSRVAAGGVDSQSCLYTLTVF